MPEVNSEILSWARKTMGLTPSDAAKKLGIRDGKTAVAEEKLRAYEDGSKNPSETMLRRMSRVYHRPLLTFYLSRVPGEERDGGQDFRTLSKLSGEQHMPDAKALVISPHPDDLEIGMGGTVCALVEKGARVVSVIVTDGRRSANPLGLAQEELVRTREKEARESSRILGVEVSLLGFPDMESPANTGGFSSEIRETIAELRPDEIYVPHPEIDKHRTHRTVSRLTLAALDAAVSESAFECGCWFYEVWTPFPSYDRIEDITPFAEKKRLAIEAHKSQTAYKDYTDGMMGLNRYRGVFHDTADGFSPVWAEIFIRRSSG